MVDSKKVRTLSTVRSHLSLKLQMALPMFYVYILKSSKSNILYYGYTTDLKKRFEEHNRGLSRSTKPHRPWKLAWYCAFQSRKLAKDFELYLKSGSGKAFTKKRLVAVAKDDCRDTEGV
ncbi:GIY-YIG nuclease family protein [Patescibacteria group bacterium]